MNFAKTGSTTLNCSANVPATAVTASSARKRGVSSTYLMPSRSCPAARATRGRGSNCAGSMAVRNAITTTYDAAFTAKHAPMLTLSIRRPASTGPTMRAIWNNTPLSATAFVSSASPTSSPRND